MQVAPSPPAIARRPVAHLAAPRVCHPALPANQDTTPGDERGRIPGHCSAAENDGCVIKKRFACRFGGRRKRAAKSPAHRPGFCGQSLVSPVMARPPCGLHTQRYSRTVTTSYTSPSEEDSSMDLSPQRPGLSALDSAYMSPPLCISYVPRLNLHRRCLC